ncbi:MAG: hypothetical protein RL240_1962 [Planctomycetota bacterium]|jgi:hypothetical protein
MQISPASNVSGSALRISMRFASTTKRTRPAYRASVPQEQFDIVMKQIERAMDPNSFHVSNRALNG